MERYLLYLTLSLVFYCSAPVASSGIHSHYFFRTVTTQDSASDYPFYYSTRSIDDITLYWYDSNSGIVERRVPWFRSAHAGLLNASIAEFNNQISQSNLLELIRNDINDTEGFHVLQRLQGCVVHENLAILSYRYDGKPFLSFNLEKVKWIAEDPRAQYLADHNNRDQTLTAVTKDILLDSCNPQITELLSLGNCTFSRKEQPVVKVTQTPITNSTSRLNCRAYGHYPKNISMTWYKNGEPVPESLMERVTLPFPDITYLTWLYMNVTLNDAIYTCNVTHSSMMSPLITDWRLTTESPEVNSGMPIGGIIVLCVDVIMILPFLVIFAVSCAKLRRQ
ncbi:hereditary hemochromatosis protein-like [Mantella aurantiaca]